MINWKNSVVTELVNGVSALMINGGSVLNGMKEMPTTLK
jgi:hypothetical protein